ncbi:hypothetical protein [Cytobacillus dafuensis]|uniref:hypothetical protein n=1 Tax=Cytobacillus dafuensis TaxID=1742359 RepID=UPI000AD45C0B|nr:hypothetical protein [Cytobacillus dafuensis]
MEISTQELENKRGLIIIFSWAFAVFLHPFIRNFRLKRTLIEDIAIPVAEVTTCQ